MKNVFILVLLAPLSFSTAFASTTDRHLVVVSGNETSDAFSLNAVATKTLYRTEEREATCYRDVFDGYETVCDGFAEVIGPHPDPGPHPDDPGRVPKPGPGDNNPSPWPDPTPTRTCHEEARYRSEAYSCTETVSVPYEVFDHNATANVNATISAELLPKTQANCGINFSLTGDDLSLFNSCVDYLATAVKTIDDQGDLKNYQFAVKLLNKDLILAPLAGNLQGMKVDADNLVVKTGDLTKGSNFTLKLYVQRRKFLAKDVVLVNRALTAKEFTYTALDAKTGLVKMNLDKLTGGFEAKKKHVIRVELDVTLPANTIANAGGAINTHQESEITINK